MNKIDEIYDISNITDFECLNYVFNNYQLDDRYIYLDNAVENGLSNFISIFFKWLNNNENRDLIDIDKIYICYNKALEMDNGSAQEFIKPFGTVQSLQCTKENFMKALTYPQIIMAFKKGVHIENMTIIISAVKNNNTEALDYFMNEGFNVNETDKGGTSLIAHTVDSLIKYKNIDLKFLEYLLKNGADPNSSRHVLSEERRTQQYYDKEFGETSQPSCLEDMITENIMDIMIGLNVNNHNKQNVEKSSLIKIAYSKQRFDIANL